MLAHNGLYYRITGNGYPVLLLHGFLEDETMWKEIRQSFEGFQFISIDLPGHGKSAEHPLTDDMQSIAQPVAKLIQSLGLTKYAVLGHSLGGYIGLELLKSSIPPASICLLNSHPFEDTPFRKENRLRLVELLNTKKRSFLQQAIPGLFMYPSNHDIEIRSLIDDAEKLPTEAIQHTTLAMRNRENYATTLLEEAKKANIYCVDGEDDVLIQHRALQDWCKEVNGMYLSIPDTAHMPFIETPDEVLECLETVFLDIKKRED
ncbi:Pimeloyl-ACP methyl ester carboxylesterase [Lishizhenia tianjinensis]|uniref:Pimeloyl-ACP methyl ester carboxylesterase n=1 Tax=Lishizhenia tianjinensis TaxID=477690 RepID=A0A1I6ZRZ8_9FLAO|nr:alpha/beta hydrolase [Lishizhenia tianjinensis]SFT65499.1 Pimeloyl-ACP methyl ester carboxylesterase [Lishizhenia tianjinensis]